MAAIEEISFGKEIALGLLIGFGFIALNALFGLVIGIPQFSFSSETEKNVVVSIVAPVAEELGFRMILPFILFTLNVPFWLNTIINIAGFSIFHFVAYGTSINAASALFIGAGLFALASFLATYYESEEDEIQIPLAAIIAHIIINTWLSIEAAKLIIIGTI